jgi:hypothetical protein
MTASLSVSRFGSSFVLGMVLAGVLSYVSGPPAGPASASLCAFPGPVAGAAVSQVSTVPIETPTSIAEMAVIGAGGLAMTLLISTWWVGPERTLGWVALLVPRQISDDLIGDGLEEIDRYRTTVEPMKVWIVVLRTGFAVAVDLAHYVLFPIAGKRRPPN